MADACDTQVATVHSETEGSDVTISDLLNQNPLPTEDIHCLSREQRKDPELFNMVTCLECGALPDEAQAIVLESSKSSLVDRTLYYGE